MAFDFQQGGAAAKDVDDWVTPSAKPAHQAVDDWISPPNAAPQPGEGPTALGALARGAVRGAPEALAAWPAMAAGAELGAAAGALTGPFAPAAVPVLGMAGGAAGAMGGGWLAAKAEEWLFNALPESVTRALGQLPAQQQADIKNHGIAAMIGELGPNLALARPGAMEKAADEGANAVARLMGHPITQRALPAVVMGAQEAGGELAQGEEPDWEKIGISAGAGALMNRQTAAGRALTELGAAPVRAITGRAALPPLPAPPGIPPAGVPAIGDTVHIDYPSGPRPATVVGFPQPDVVELQHADKSRELMTVPDLAARQVPAPEQSPVLPPAVPAEEAPPAAAPISPRAEPTIQPPPATPVPEPASALQPGPEDIAAEKARQDLAATAGIPPPPPVAEVPTPIQRPEDAAADKARQNLVAVAQPVPPPPVAPIPPPTPAQPVPPPPMAAAEPIPPIVPPQPAPMPPPEAAPVIQPPPWIDVGKNQDGQTLYEDPRGVRSYVDENGIRHTEPVQMVPTRGGMQVATNRPNNPEYEIAPTPPPLSASPRNPQEKEALEKVRRIFLSYPPGRASLLDAISEAAENEDQRKALWDVLRREVREHSGNNWRIEALDRAIKAAPVIQPEPTPPPLSVSPRNPQEVGREIAQAREDTDTTPTKDQQSSGNYAKGRVDFHGLPFVMENPIGSIRRGGPPENPWEVEMPADYGYLARAEGADREQVDAYLGPHPESGHAFVIDQIDADTKAFDEHKVMLGFNSWPEARAIYEQAFSDGRGAERIGNMTPMTLSEIKTWLRDGDMQNPIGKGEFGFERINPPAPEPGTPTEAKAPPFQLADMVTNRLTRGQTIGAKDLQTMAEQAYGGKLAEGKFTRQSMYDALELGVNQYVQASPAFFDPRADLNRAKEIVRGAEAVKNNLATQTVRAGEKDRFQQFSTPPDYAYAAAWLGNIRPTDRVLEPSAGNGSLVAMAKNAGPREITANELFLPRAEALDALGTTRTFREDAEQLNNILPADVRPSLVLMNPPFSATAGRMGDKTVLMTGARHIDQALARLDPGGRLVAIVGRGMTMDAPTFRNWWANILRNYDVRANVGVPGSVYQKYGTNFATRMLVIDKVPPSGRPIVGGNAASLPEAMERLDAVRTDRPGAAGEPVAPQPSGVPVAQPGATPGEPRPPIPGPTPVGGLPGGTPGAGTRPEVPVGTGAGVRGVAGPEPQPGPRDALVHQQPEHPIAGGAEPNAAVAPGAGQELGGSGAGPNGVVLRPEGGAGPVLPAGGEPSIVAPSGEPAGPPPETVRVDEIAADPTSGAGVTEAVYEPYKPQRIAIEGAKAHPGDLVQSAAMASVMPPVVDYAPRLPKNLISTGALSDAQLEAITYAGHAHSQILPTVVGETPYRRGYFIGDGTGVGKGREIAGVILDNFLQGRQKALWISERGRLINDAHRDWTGLGGQKADVFDLGKVKAGGDIKPSRGIAFLTYDTLKGGERPTKGEAGETVPGQRRLDQLVKWLGPDFSGVVIFDEAHNLSNIMPTQGPRGVKPAAQKALAGVELQQKLPNARIVYASATGATEVSNLAYAQRLGLWGRGTAFPDARAFINSIGSGGVAAMELVARDMKAMGSYLSRNLSYDDVKYDRLEHNLTPEQKEIYDGLAEGWQHVLRNINAALKVTAPTDQSGVQRPDSKQRAQALSAFWGAHQRFFNQIITAIQMPSVIRGIEADLKEGKQAVLQFVNTGEAPTKRALEERRAMEGPEGEDLYEDLDLTPKRQLAEMINKSFPTQQIETYVDENGNERTRGVTDSAGNLVHNPEALRLKEALLDKVGSLRVPDSPLDMVINHFGPDKVAEVTGRKERIVHVPDKDGVVRATPEKRGSHANENEINAFQNAKKPILAFSGAGNTGGSYHADLTSPSANAQRSHYLVQPGWRADQAIQGFGRTHRTNQASAPIFHLVTTDLQGQKRFISSIARRLSQLGALTKGERRAGESGMFSARDNLEGPEANAAIRDFWRSLQRNDVQGVDPRDFEQQTGLHLRGEKGEDSDPPEVTQFLNRLLSLKYDMQNHVFGEFDRRLQDATDRAAAAGTLDMGTETLRGDRINKIEEKTVYTDPQSGAETKYVRLKVDTKNKPASFDQVSSGRRLTAGRIPEFYAASKSSGKVYAVSEASSRTDANGRVSDMYRLSDPLQWHFIERGRLGDDRYWDRIADEKQARGLWDKQVAALPEYNSQDTHLITGAVLPIWDRLSGTPKVFRTQTDDGERLLGRVIQDDRIDQTLRALGTETSGRTYAPQYVADRIMQGDRATLANGWTLKRSLVAGEPRIEVVGPNYTHRDELSRDGVFTERIAYDTRFFVPTGEQAAPTLERLLERRPVTEMASTGLAEGLAEAPRGWATADAFAEQFPHEDTTAEARNFRAAGSYDDGLAGGNAAARDYVFMVGSNTGKEHFAAVGPDGQVVDAGTNGSRDMIRFSDETLRQIYNPDAPALAFHHNHPSDSPLSIPDIMALSAHGMASVAAHGHEGSISSASLTPEAREALFQLDPNERQQRLKNMAMGAELIAAEATDPLVKRGMLSKQRADEILREARNRLLAANGIIDYVSTRTLPGWLTARIGQLLRGPNAGEIGDRLNRSAGALRPEEAMGRISDTHAEIAAGRPAGAGGAGAGAAGAGAPARPATRLAEEPPGGGGPPRPPEPPEAGGTPEERRAALDAVMHTDRRGLVDHLKAWVDRIKTGGMLAARQYVLDDLAGLEAQEKAAHGGKLLPAGISPTASARLARNSAAITDFTVRYGQVRFNPETGVTEQIPNAKSLTDILKPIAALGQQAVDDFKLWAIVMRAQRLMGEGRERNVSEETINKYRYLDRAYAQPDGSNPFVQAHIELQQFNRHLLDFGQATGLLNPESRALFEHGDYVPFFRALGEDDIRGATPGRRGLANVRSPIRELKGGEAKVNDIFDNLVMNTTSMIRRGMNNQAMRLTVGELSGTEALTPLSKIARAELGTPESRSRLLDLGLDPATMDAKAKEAAKGLFGAIMKHDPNVVSVMENGKAQYYQVNNPLLLRSLVSLGPASVDALTRLFSGPARLLRSAVVFDPAFMLAHNLRMAEHSYVLTGTSPYASIRDAIRMARGLTPEAMKLMAAGAVSGRYDVGLPRTIRMEIEGRPYQNSLISTARDAAHFLRRLGEAGTRAADLGPRVAVYRKALAEGLPEADAIEKARDLLDFSTHGDGGAARFLAQTIPFLNARWQGLARTGRGLVGEDRNSVMMRAGLLTAATIALWYYNKANNSDKWDRLEDWDKQYAWHFWIGDQHWRLPKPFEIGAVTGSLPEIILDYFDNSSMRQVQNAASSLMLNIFRFNPIPVAVRPVLEAFFNEDSYTGRPIVNEAEAARVPDLQYGPTTSPSVVALTQAFNAGSPHQVSPEVVQHLLRGYLAGWQGYITAATDSIGQSAGWLPTQASWGGADIPVVDRFVRTGPESGNRIQTDFYDLKKEVSQVGQSLKDAESKGDQEMAARLMQKHPEYNPALDKTFQRAGQMLAQQRKMISRTLLNPTMPSRTKRDALDRFYTERDQLLDQLVPLVRRAQGLPDQED